MVWRYSTIQFCTHNYVDGVICSCWLGGADDVVLLPARSGVEMLFAKSAISPIHSRHPTSSLFHLFLEKLFCFVSTFPILAPIPHNMAFWKSQAFGDRTGRLVYKKMSEWGWTPTLRFSSGDSTVRSGRQDQRLVWSIFFLSVLSIKGRRFSSYDMTM